MNKVILMGRLTRDPDIRYSTGESATAVARYTLAVDRRFRRDGEQTADFIGCVAFGRNAEFAESKSVSDSSRSAYAGGNNYGQAPAQTSAPKPMSADGFMNIPDGIEEELPFN